MTTTSSNAGSGLWRFVQRIDALLRQVAGGGGEVTEAVPTTRQLLGIGIACGATYGLAMGLHAASMRGWPGVAQMLSAALKVPCLFLLTIAVTYPSFYVLSVVRGGASDARQLLQAQLVGTALATALLASLGPITVFFTLSTESHGFMVLLNAAFFAVAAVLGLRAVWTRGKAALGAGPGAGSRGLGLLRAWFVIAVAVGAQSAWILRPLVGRPGDGFVLFESRESNALAGFLEILGDMVR
jgi:hypothetical protein